MQKCSRCLLPDTYPGITFDKDGVCVYCKRGSQITNDISTRQELIKELTALSAENREQGRKYDVLVPVSGGVDSCNTLIDLVETYQLRPLVFHNDHGYEDETATQNVQKLCKALQVDLIIQQHDTVFMKKLWKCVNRSSLPLSGCYVCGNILYLNALELASRFGINMVINGYSKGQIYMVHDKNKGHDLLEMLLEIIEGTNDSEFIRQFFEKYNILQKRVAFESKRDFQVLRQSNKILVLPFFLFSFHRLDKEKLKKRVMNICDWRPLKHSYPGRTTNCKMVWLNCYMDLQKMGYSCYHEEYSELIRKNEISRKQAEIDLELVPPAGLLKELADDIGVPLTNNCLDF